MPMADDRPTPVKGGPAPSRHDVSRRSLIATGMGAVAAEAVRPAASNHQARPAVSQNGMASTADFGTLGTGTSNAADQDGFRHAIAAANASGRYVAGVGASYWAHPQDGLFIPAGVYDAEDLKITGNHSPFPALSLWAIPGSVVIRIPEGRYLFEADERLNWLFMSGITFVGGKGAFQHRFDGTNVNGRFVFERCVFDNYTECAIGNNARDQPYLEVRGCTFMAAPKSSAIGIAWGGYADGCIIEGNAFLRNRFHLKLGPDPSGSIHVLRNDFIRWDGDTPFDAAIWLVPEVTPGRFGVNSGWGTIISGNKFGNENMSPRDVRILVAREGAGTTRQTRSPSKRFDTGGAAGAFLSGVTIENNRIGCPADVEAPLMRSWIAEIRNLSYLNNRHHGGLHSYLCEFMGQRPVDYANANWTVSLDDAEAVLGSSPFSHGISNAAINPRPDPAATQAIAEETILPGTGGDDTSFVLLAAADRTPAFAPGGAGVTLTPAMDHSGFPRGVDVRTTHKGTGVAGALTGVKPLHQAWLAVDLRRAPGGDETAITVAIFNHATGATARKLRYPLPPEWRRIRIPFTMPASERPDTWQYLITSDASGSEVTHFQLARLFVYHGREPRADGHVTTLSDGKWDGGHLVMGQTHVWEEGGALYLKVGGAPRNATDGTRLS